MRFLNVIIIFLTMFFTLSACYGHSVNVAQQTTGEENIIFYQEETPVHNTGGVFVDGDDTLHYVTDEETYGCCVPKEGGTVYIPERRNRDKSYQIKAHFYTDGNEYEIEVFMVRRNYDREFICYHDVSDSNATEIPVEGVIGEWYHLYFDKKEDRYVCQVKPNASKKSRSIRFEYEIIKEGEVKRWWHTYYIRQLPNSNEFSPSLRNERIVNSGKLALRTFGCDVSREGGIVHILQGNNRNKLYSASFRFYTKGHEPPKYATGDDLCDYSFNMMNDPDDAQDPRLPQGGIVGEWYHVYFDKEADKYVCEIKRNSSGMQRMIYIYYSVADEKGGRGYVHYYLLRQR